MNEILEIVNDVLLDYASEMTVTPSEIMAEVRKRLDELDERQSEDLIMPQNR